MHARARPSVSLSRRDFLTPRRPSSPPAPPPRPRSPRACRPPRPTPMSVIGDWAADGSRPRSPVPGERRDQRHLASDGTYREHNAAAFPADDATPIPPRAVPAAWDCECDIVRGGRRAAAASTPRPAPPSRARRTICVEALGLHGGNAQEAGMCAILGGIEACRSPSSFAFPSYPFDARKRWPTGPSTSTTTPADPLAHPPASRRRAATASTGWPTAACSWRLGEVPVYVAPKNSTLDHHVLKMKDATDAMFALRSAPWRGSTTSSARPRRSCSDGDGRVVGVVASRGLRRRRSYIHARQRAVILTAGGFCNNKALLQRYIPTAAMGCASRATSRRARRASASAWGSA